MPPEKPRSGKDLIWIVRYCSCGTLIRGLQNLETPCKGGRIVTFCGVQKVTQKARARTHKKLPVASFCASETAETGRIANGCEQGDHVSRSRQVLRPWFKALQRNAFYRNCSGSCLKQFLGFEPVQKGCCTSDARPMFFRKWDIALQAHRGECIRKG